MKCRELCRFYAECSQSSNLNTYISIDWNYVIESGMRRNHSMVGSSCNFISSQLDILKNSTRPMFTIMNQASFEQLLTYCPRVMDHHLHKLTIFDTRLSTLYNKARGLDSYRINTLPFPLYSNTKVISQLPRSSKKSSKLYISTGSSGHNVCRKKLEPFTEKKKVRLSEWTRRVASADMVLMCGGTFPATFMIYETILLGSIPVIIIPTTTLLSITGKAQNYTNRHVLYDNMPFSDDGVDWKKFSIIKFERDINFNSFVNTLNSTSEEEIASKKKALESVRHRFLPKNAFNYASYRTPRSFLHDKLYR